MAEGEARGAARGESRAILSVLEARGVLVSDDARARINSCTDIDLLETWLRRAVNATSAKELFV